MLKKLPVEDSLKSLESHVIKAVEEAGTTTGFNSQYNGDKFAEQVIQVEALAQSDFDAWVAGAGNAPVLDQTSYAVIGQQGVLKDAQDALGMSDTRLQLGDATIFDQVVARYTSGQPVSSEDQPGSPAYQAEATQ